MKLSEPFADMPRRFGARLPQLPDACASAAAVAGDAGAVPDHAPIGMTQPQEFGDDLRPVQAASRFATGNDSRTIMANVGKSISIHALP